MKMPMMTMMRRKLTPAMLVLLLASWMGACQGSGDNGDGGHEDADGNGSDPGSGDDGTVTDEDLGDDYGLLVPAGFQACAMPGFIWPEYVADTVAGLGRITIKPGLYRLYRDRDTFTADLIEQVEWGPEPRTGTPTDPGTFTRQGENYTYVQEVLFGQDLMQVELRVSFEVWEEPGPGPVIELNETAFTDFRVSLGATLGTTGSYFLACACEKIDNGVYTFTLDDGDTIAVQVCSFCGGMCKNSEGFCNRAEVSFSGQSRTVEDPTQLGIRFGQHDWSANVLVYLREPLAGYSGAVIELGNLLMGQTAHLFDQTYQIVETKGVTNTEHRTDC
jgi:hypothetical protein